MTLDEFLRTRTRADHLQTVSIKELHKLYLETIPPADHVAWRRTRFASELAARGFPVQIVGKTYHATGLALA